MISSGVPATAKSQFTRTTFVFVPVEFLFLRQNTMTKKHVRREGSNQLTYLHCCSSLEEVRTGTQAGQEPGGRGQGRELLISLLSYRTQKHQPRDGPTHSGLVLSHQSLQACPQPNLMEVFSQLRLSPS